LELLGFLKERWWCGRVEVPQEAFVAALADFEKIKAARKAEG
jgi:hypothetical protein